MQENEHKTIAATTVRELGIQFDGFKDVTRLQFKEVNTNLTNLVRVLHEANSTKADQKDLVALAATVATKADQKDVDANTRVIGKRWVNNSLSAVLGAILTGLVGLVVYLLASVHK